MNRSYQGFEDFMNHASGNDLLLDEETMQKVRNSIQHLDLSGFDERGLIDYRNEIRDVYGQDPLLSQEMKSFLAELFEGAQSDYEKLKRAEAILGAMGYTNAPGELPEEAHSPAAFADYLIFRSKKGYCTHYATAFVLIARSLGCPARYVQGYCFTTAENGTTNVISGTAHAWPEVYFPGKGWISFEPTPGFLIHILSRIICYKISRTR
jgi:transglutaminase-like putative cysteine protease